MSVVGFDFGTRNCTVAVVRQRKLDIATNEASMRYTPNVVGFTFKKRETGEAGKTQFLRNANNSIYGPKFLLGRKFKDEVVQRNIDKYGACRWTELPNGDIGVTANYAGNQTLFTSEQLAACMLTNLKKTTEAFTEAPCTSCVVSCPGWWSHKQRKALLNACLIADLTPLRIVNDLSAVAFNYGFYHPAKFDEKSERVMFVSLGHFGFQCNIVEMSKLNCTVKSVAYDLSLGGSLIDELLADHFATRFNEKHKVNIKDNKRVMLKILLSMESVKKTLNTNPKASISQDCLYEGIDLQDSITKDEYLAILDHHQIPQRVVACVNQCLEGAKMSVGDLYAIEWVGSGMRMQVVRDALEALYGKPLSATMNAEEATAMGCSLICARLSPTAHTRPYDLVELNDVPVSINWRTINDDSDTKVSTAVLFPAGYALPGPKARNSTFNRPNAKPFEIELKYGDSAYIPAGCETIGVCRIPNIPKSGAAEADVRVKFKADPNGTFSFVQADLVEEKEEVVEVPEDSEKMDTESDAKKTRKETKKVEVTTKLAFEAVFDELDAAKVTEFKKIENEMRARDQAVVDNLNAKNDLETFVYYVRDKIDGVWKEFGTPEELKKLDGLLDETSGWLYGDGEDTVKDEYTKKKNPVSEIANKLSKRYNEWTAVPAALEELQLTIHNLKTEASEGAESKYAHIAKEEMEKVFAQIEEAQKVVDESKSKWSGVSKQQDPPVASVDLKMRKDNLTANVMKILLTPKPVVEPPKEEVTKMEEEKPAEATATAENTADTKDAPMETETN